MWANPLGKGGTMETYDIAVIGAGPAGAAAACRAAPHARVALIERYPLPREKLCSGVLSPKSMKELDGIIDLARHVQGTSHRTWIGRGDTGREVRHRTELIFVARRTFDEALAREAVRRGATLLEGVRVTAVDAEEGRLALSTGDELRASVVIGADGANGVSRRAAGEALVRGVGMEARVSDPRPVGERPVLLDFSVPRGYSWAFPKADGGVAVGAGTGYSPFPELRQHLDAFASRHGFTLPSSVPGHPLPFGFSRHPARGRLMLAGDAAAVMDPVIAEGIPFALWTGRKAAERALSHLRESSPLHAYAADIAYLRRFLFLQRVIARMDRILEPPLVRAAGLPILRDAIWHHVIDRPLPV